MVSEYLKPVNAAREMFVASKLLPSRVKEPELEVVFIQTFPKSGNVEVIVSVGTDGDEVVPLPTLSLE